MTLFDYTDLDDQSEEFLALREPSFDLDPYDWLELDLQSMALDSN